MKKIRVLHVLESFSTGGIERTVVDLVTRYNKEKFTVMAFSVSPYKGRIFEERLKKLGANVFYGNGKNNLASIYKLYKVIKDFKPDVIHTHHYGIIYALIPLVFCNVTAKVNTIHVDALLEAHYLGNKTGKTLSWILSRTQGGIAEKVRTITYKVLSLSEMQGDYKRICINKNSEIYKPIDIQSFIKSAQVGAKLFEIAYKVFGFRPVAVSKSVRNSAEELYSMKNIPVIYNGISLEDYQYKAFKNDDTIKIIHVGRFDQGKNQEFLIDAFGIIAKEIDSVRLILIGDGEYRGKIIKKIARMNLLDKIEYLGIRDNIEHVLASCHIFVISPMTEGFGIVLLEAMAAGVPVVATNIGGIPEIIKNGVNGILVEPNNVEAFAQSVIELIRDKNLRETIGKKGRDSVTNFYIKKTIKEYEILYTSMALQNMRANSRF